MRRSFDAVVVGAGVMGLCAAWHLGRMGHRVAVIERFRVGHVRGSSHGSTRVARAAYADPAWARFAQTAIDDGWGLVERASGAPLMQRQPVLLFGPADGPLQAYAAATDKLPGVTRMSAEVAQSQAPQLAIDDEALVLQDRTGGVLRAADALRTLRRLIVEEGGLIFEASTVLRVNPGGSTVVLETERGTVECEHLVMTLGPWTPHVLPFLAPALTVSRQFVGHAEVLSPTAAEDFPVWARIAEDEFVYGLPAVQRQGVKIAYHEPYTHCCDARRFVSTAPVDREARLLDAARRLFADPVTRLGSTETCLYTTTHNEDFIVDLHPEDTRIAIGAGFSGHGFKFAPLIGQILAELASRGKSTVPGFVELRPRLAIGTHLRAAAAAAEGR